MFAIINLYTQAMCILKLVFWYKIVGPLKLDLGQNDENNVPNKASGGAKGKYLQGEHNHERDICT